MTGHKAQSVFAGNIPLWSLQQGGELIFQQILYSFSAYFGGEMGVTVIFWGWQQFCDHMFLRINSFVKIRKQVFLYGLLSRY